MTISLHSCFTVPLLLALTACAAEDQAVRPGTPNRKAEVAVGGCPCGACPGARAGGGAGLGMRRGAAGKGSGFGPAMARCNVGGGALDAATRNAVEAALADERNAAALYEGVLDELGDVTPFSRLARAERRHAQALERVLTSHGHVAPEPRAVDGDPPSTLPNACSRGVRAEADNVALYDRLLGGSLPEDVRCVFEHLRDASESRHLPTLRACSG